MKGREPDRTGLAEAVHQGRLLVVILYAHSDGADFAQLLATKLSGTPGGEPERQIWLDVESIGATGAWREEVARAVAGAALVLVITSRRSIESLNVAFELGLVIAGGVPFVDLRLDAGVALPSELRPAEVMDFSQVAHRPWARMSSVVARHARG
jgi:hypothetical protein